MLVKKPEFQGLQILRALAALMVVFYHLFDSLKNDFGIGAVNLFNFGLHGVDLFFVLSGFIVCHASWNETNARRFFLKRLIRVLPLYYGATLGLVAIALVAPWLLNTTTIDWPGVVKSLLFIAYEQPSGRIEPFLFLGWTLNYEMFFYILAAITIAIPRFRVHNVWILITALWLAGRLLDTENIFARFYLDGIILEFAYGVGIFWIFRHRRDWLRAGPVILFAGFGALILLEIGNTLTLRGVLAPIQIFVDGPREFSRGLPAAMIVFGFASLAPTKNRLATSIEKIGDASYALYLTHPYVVQAGVKLVMPLLGVSLLSFIIMGTLVIGVCVGLALLIYYRFEASTIRYLRRRLVGPIALAGNTKQPPSPSPRHSK